MLVLPGPMACLWWATLVSAANFPWGNWKTGWHLATQYSDSAPIQSLWYACFVQSQLFLILYLVSIARYRSGLRYLVLTTGTVLGGLIGMCGALSLIWFGEWTLRWADTSIVAVFSPPTWGAAIGMLIADVLLRRMHRAS